MPFDYATQRPADVEAVKHWLTYAVDSRSPAERGDDEVVRPSSYVIVLKYVDSEGAEIAHQAVALEPGTIGEENYAAVVAAYESGKTPAQLLAAMRQLAAVEARLKEIAKAM